MPSFLWRVSALISLQSFDAKMGCRCIIFLHWKLFSFTWHLNIKLKKTQPFSLEGRPRLGLWCWAIRLWGQRDGQHVPWPSFGLCQLTLTQKFLRHSQGPGLIPRECCGHGQPCFGDRELSCTTWPQGKEPFPGLCSFPFSLSVRRKVRD